MIPTGTGSNGRRTIRVVGPAGQGEGPRVAAFALCIWLLNRSNAFALSATSVSWMMIGSPTRNAFSCVALSCVSTVGGWDWVLLRVREALLSSVDLEGGLDDPEMSQLYLAGGAR